MSATAALAPQATENPVLTPAESQPELIRRRNQKAERNIRMIGACFVVSGVIGLVAIAIPILLQIPLLFLGGEEVISGFFRSASVNLIFALIPAIFVKSGRRLQKLLPNSRLGGIVLSCLTCFCFFPFGLAVGIAGLVILNGKQAQSILSTDYEEVIAKTPHITGRSPWLIPTAYGVITVLYLGAIALMIVSNIAKIASQG